MLLARNLAANAVGQTWAFVLNILALPVYLWLLGAESYALVGFGLTVQIWVNLLDAGMSPTLSREMTRMRSGDMSEADVLRFVRSLDWVFLALTAIVIALAVATRDWWAAHWFQDHALSGQIIAHSMVLILAFSAIRCTSALYRSAIMGLERQVFTSIVGICANAGRLLLPIPFLFFVRDIRLLFLFWLLVSIVEITVLRWVLARAFTASVPLFYFSIDTFRQRAMLSGSIAAFAVLGTFITQTDKIILSRILPLAEYGHFSLAIVLSGAILMIPAPVLAAFQPRITAMAIAGDDAALRRLFHSAAQILTVFSLAPTIVLAALPYTAILAWTGDATAASAVAPYLGPYLMGSSLMGMVWLIYAVQLGHGKLRLHLAANMLFAVTLVPAFTFVTSRYGASGAALLWLGMNLICILVYVPIALRRFLPGATRQWLLGDLAAPLAVALLVAGTVRVTLGDAVDRQGIGLAVILTTLAVATTAAGLATPVIRNAAGSARQWISWVRARSVSPHRDV